MFHTNLTANSRLATPTTTTTPTTTELSDIPDRVGSGHRHVELGDYDKAVTLHRGRDSADQAIGRPPTALVSNAHSPATG